MFQIILHKDNEDGTVSIDQRSGVMGSASKPCKGEFILNNKIKEYSGEFLHEQKALFYTSPKDEIDWALIMYLFKYSTEPYGYSMFYKEPRNVITIGKIAKYFDLNQKEVYNRLNRMIWWVSVATVYGYYKPVTVCTLTLFGIKVISKTLEIFDIDKV